MPRAWDDRPPAEDGFDRTPVGAPASEELAHEIALAAALDRSRRDLSPDPHPLTTAPEANLATTSSRSGVCGP